VNASRRIWMIAAGALVLRLLLLWVRGDYIVYDEGYYLLLARSLRAGHGFALNGLPHVALSPLQPLVVAALSFTGLPDLWASRLLAAVCGALLVVPVAALARRWYGDTGAVTAAVLIALFPSLITLLPFFPGERWNLYFGSEPLYLLLAVSAIVVAMRAVEAEQWRWWFITGALGALAWLTRLEGIVLCAALGVSMLAALAVRRRLALWPRAIAAIIAGVVIGAPYLVYLHGALGRWALSGRVQAAAAVAPAVPAVSGGSGAVREFVWGGNTEILWRTLYALDAAGTQMASQYWGVPRRMIAPAGSANPATPAPATPAARSPRPDPEARPGPAVLTTIVRATLVVVPLWFMALAIVGLMRTRPLRDAAIWLSPMVLASLAPALLAYAEPRVLLLLAPAACILATGACEELRVMAERRPGAGRSGPLIPGAVAVLLLFPTAHDISRAWGQQTPLQQLASARRIVGEYLGAHLGQDARIVSWHPATAIFARRDWRVLPYTSFDRIIFYARAQGAEAVVFSRFEPSPLREAPRAFTAVLLDDAGTAPSGSIKLDQVDVTPTLFVGRLASAQDTAAVRR
jgi:4-amino-4-deoxy-L-arabinose transferase-like glycosyltransferase